MNKLEQLANLKQGFAKGFITEKEFITAAEAE